MNEKEDRKNFKEYFETENLIFINTCLYIKRLKALIISDIHIGYEESMLKSGFLVPRIQYKETITILDSIFDVLNRLKKRIDKIIITGDLKHEFSTISKQEWSEVFRLIRYFKEKSDEIILVKGNHDTITKPFLKENLKQYDYLIDKDYMFVHGDKYFGIKAENIVQGHMHPIINLRDDINHGKYKAFIYGKPRKGIKAQSFIILPAFNPLTLGFDIKDNAVFSPYLKYYDMENAFALTTQEYLLFPLNRI